MSRSGWIDSPQPTETTSRDDGLRWRCPDCAMVWTYLGSGAWRGKRPGAWRR